MKEEYLLYEYVCTHMCNLKYMHQVSGMCPIPTLNKLLTL